MRNAVPSARCPHCGATVDVVANRVYPGLLRELISSDADASPEAQIESASLLACPTCGTQFQSDAVRFFGMLTPRGVRYLFIAVVILIAAFWGYVALSQ